MLGRPVLMSIAAAIGSLLSVTGASASCYSCGCSAPPVYSYSYAMPCATYAAPPMYIVNQGPAYTLPVPIAAEPTPAYSYPYVGRPQAYYGDDEQQYEVYPRSYRRHHWRQSYGYDRYQDRGFRLDRGYRNHSRPYIGMSHHHPSPTGRGSCSWGCPQWPTTVVVCGGRQPHMRSIWPGRTRPGGGSPQVKQG